MAIHHPDGLGGDNVVADISRRCWLDVCGLGRLSEDGLHPNARGNKVLAQAVAAAIRRLKSRGQ